MQVFGFKQDNSLYQETLTQVALFTSKTISVVGFTGNSSANIF